MRTAQERVEWVEAATGQHYVSTASHHGATGQPYVHTRPVYPGAAPAVHPELVRDVVKVVPALRPREIVPLNDPKAPGSARSLARLAVENGWTTRLSRSAGPRIAGDGFSEETSYVYALRADKPGRRVIACWRWSATTKKWGTDGNWILPRWQMVNAADVKEALKS